VRGDEGVAMVAGIVHAWRNDSEVEDAYWEYFGSLLPR